MREAPASPKIGYGSSARTGRLNVSVRNGSSNNILSLGSGKIG